MLLLALGDRVVLRLGSTFHGLSFLIITLKVFKIVTDNIYLDYSLESPLKVLCLFPSEKVIILKVMNQNIQPIP